MLKYSLETLGPFDIAFYRFLIASIVFIPLLILVKERYSLSDFLRLLVLAFTGVFMYQVFFIFGEKGLTAGNASFIVSTEPLFILLLSALIRQDKINYLYIAGLAISTGGLVVLLQPGTMNSNETYSVILVLIAALSWAIYTVVGKKVLSSHNPIHVTGVVSIIGAIMLFPFSGIPSITSLISLRGSPLYAVLFLGIFATFIGYILWFDGLKYLKPSIAGVTLYITPFITVLTADLMLSENPTLSTIIGGILITAGIAVTNLKTAGGDKDVR